MMKRNLVVSVSSIGLYLTSTILYFVGFWIVACVLLFCCWLVLLFLNEKGFSKRQKLISRLASGFVLFTLLLGVLFGRALWG